MIRGNFLHQRSVRFARRRTRAVALAKLGRMLGRVLLVDFGRALLPRSLLVVRQRSPLVTHDAGHLAEGAVRVRGADALPVFARVQNVPGDELFARLFVLFPRARLGGAEGVRRNWRGRHQHVGTDRRWPIDRVVDDAELVLAVLE